MSSVVMSKKDEIIMKLVHYLITEENYTPIIINGVKDEIWLENNSGPYKIVRINSNYIHNNEQYTFDMFKTKNVVKQIKKKTFSLSMNVLTIFLDVNPDVPLKEDKNISAIKVNDVKDLKNKKGLGSIFPMIKEKLMDDEKGIDLIVNVTKDINEKTEKENKTYEDTFKQKKIIITPILVVINVIIFLLIKAGFTDLFYYGANYGPAFREGEVWRLITCAFIHLDFWHLLFNMYALHIIGSQIENFVGKTKFLLIYFFSALTGSLMSIVFSNYFSIGASGAIFGLMGALVYFGYHYRLYLGTALRNQIIPLIAINLLLGFVISNIDVAAHVGGLVGGFLITIALGVAGKSKKSEKVNGWIVFILYTIFLTFMTFMK